MFCVSFLLFFKCSRKKWSRDNEKGQHVMALGNRSVFFFIIILEKTKDRSYPASLCNMTFSFRHFHFLVKLSSQKWTQKYFKCISTIFLLKSQASNLNDSLLILIYRSFHFQTNNTTVERRNERYAHNWWSFILWYFTDKPWHIVQLWPLLESEWLKSKLTA